jgi:hypothetical protein
MEFVVLNSNGSIDGTFSAGGVNVAGGEFLLVNSGTG